MTQYRRLQPVLCDEAGELVLQRATEEDSSFAFAMRKAAFRTYLEKSWGWHEQRELDLHDRNFAVHDYRVITWRGTIRGIVSLAEPDDCIQVNQIFLAPEHQGQGIGKRCMVIVIAEGQRLVLPVRLRVLKVNPRAKAFYERLTFRIVEEIETHFIMECSSHLAGPA